MALAVAADVACRRTRRHRRQALSASRAQATARLVDDPY